MITTTYTNFRKHLKAFLDEVSCKQTQLLVTQVRGGDVVVLTKGEYESMQETFYPLQSLKNASRLLAG